MRWGIALILAGLVLASCSHTEPPKPVLMTPSSRLIFHDGTHGIWTMCDRGTRLYMTHEGLFQAVPNGCLSGEP